MLMGSAAAGVAACLATTAVYAGSNHAGHSYDDRRSLATRDSTLTTPCQSAAQNEATTVLDSTICCHEIDGVLSVCLALPIAHDASS